VETGSRRGRPLVDVLVERDGRLRQAAVEDEHLEALVPMPEFQNVRFEKICEAPFVNIVALRDVAAGEELWIDCRPRYRYDFMEAPAAVAFFADLRSKRAGKD
jgi:hypothetical protein